MAESSATAQPWSDVALPCSPPPIDNERRVSHDAKVRFDVDLGTTGIWTTYRAIGEENAGEAARLVEELGYGTFWLGGSPRLPSVRPLLDATDNLVVATSIVNVWAYEPVQLAAEYAALAADFPDRLLVGIGVGHPEATREYAKPLAAMGTFFDGLDAAPARLPTHHRCMAALGPKMLELSADRSLGAIPYFTPVEHTRIARTEIGSAPLLAPELAVALDDDSDRARDKALEYAARYLSTHELHEQPAAMWLHPGRHRRRRLRPAARRGGSPRTRRRGGRGRPGPSRCRCRPRGAAGRRRARGSARVVDGARRRDGALAPRATRARPARRRA